MKIAYEKPSIQEYIALRLKAGMGSKSEQKAMIALEQSLFIVTIREEEALIGLGRVAGDGAISYVVTDIMVDPAYQRRGIGMQIMQAIDDYLEAETDEDAYIILLATKPADKLYAKFKFDYAEPRACGMLRRR